jgi:hypothetical protein
MKNLIRSLFSMGCLGWIFMFMVLAIFVGSFAAISNLIAFDTIWQRIDALATLEDQVSTHLREMQLSELYYTYNLDYGLDLGENLDEVAGHADQIDQGLDDLVAGGHFSADMGYGEEEIGLFNDFRTLLVQHRQGFEQMAQAYESGDAAATIEGLIAIQEENGELQGMLDELIADLDADRLEAAQAFPEEISFAILGASVALVAVLLLALVGYRAITLLTEPVVDLTNAVVAIGGDQYRPELLGRMLKQGGPPGRFARALDAFAQAIERRDASLKQEIDGLREQLYESRRRRLKISTPER